MCLNTILPASFVRNLSLVCVLLVGIMWSKTVLAYAGIAHRREVIIIPFEMTPPPDNHIMVELIINKRPCKFVLDTGTNYWIVMDTHAARELHLPIQRLEIEHRGDFTGQTLIPRLDLPFLAHPFHKVQAPVATFASPVQKEDVWVFSGLTY